MINWRSGKAGFVGGLKYAIKGVFQFVYSKTSTTIDPATSSFGVSGPIETFGRGVTGVILSTGQGVTGTTSNTFAVCGSMNTTGRGVTGLITDVGQGVSGEIKD